MRFLFTYILKTFFFKNRGYYSSAVYIKAGLLIQSLRYLLATVPPACFSVQDVCFSNSGSTKFAFAFRNDKIPSQCSVKVFCKDMYGAYCSGYRLELWIRELHARHTVFDFFHFCSPEKYWLKLEKSAIC